MKNHELLNLIGDVNEDYVLEAGSNVVKPQFRWKTIAAWGPRPPPGGGGGPRGPARQPPPPELQTMICFNIRFLV